MPSFTVRSSQSQVYQVPGWPEPGKSKGPHSWKIRSLTNFHMHLGKACFSMWAVLATVLFHGSHPLAYALLNEELQLKWSSPETMEKWPLELRLCNCFIVSDCTHQSPSQVNFNSFWSQFVLILLGKWAYIHVLSWYTFFIFLVVHVYFAIANLTSLSYWSQLVYCWFELLIRTGLEVINAVCRPREQWNSYGKFMSGGSRLKGKKGDYYILAVHAKLPR